MKAGKTKRQPKCLQFGSSSLQREYSWRSQSHGWKYQSIDRSRDRWPRKVGRNRTVCCKYDDSISQSYETCRRLSRGRWPRRTGRCRLCPSFVFFTSWLFSPVFLIKFPCYIKCFYNLLHVNGNYKQTCTMKYECGNIWKLLGWLC